MSVIVDANGKDNGLDERELRMLSRVLGPNFSTQLKGWAIVTEPHGRWLGFVLVEYRRFIQGRVKDNRPLRDGETREEAGSRESPRTFDVLDRVDLAPAFVMSTPAHGLQSWTTPQGQKYVGAAYGDTVFASEVSTSFHPVRQLAVTSIQFIDEANADFRRKCLGYVADAVLGMKDEKGLRPGER